VKKVLVVNSQVPFISGGAEILADNLIDALINYGYDADLVNLPFSWRPAERIPENILATKLLDLTETCGENIDLLIALKFPAYYVKHSNKVLWLLHQHRPAYDLWRCNYSDLSCNGNGKWFRDIIVHSDNKFLMEFKKRYTISHNVTNRFKKYNNIDSIPLYHPPINYERLHSGKYENYVFFPSRIGGLKRQELAIKSMKHVKSNVELTIAGRPDSKHNIEILNKLTKKLNLQKRVKVLPDITEEEKIRLYANTMGVLFIPYDEDYGYITLEAMYSRKPVITCTDSGGPLEFVEDNQTGYIRNPNPVEIADAIDRLYLERERAKKMGQTGYDKIISMDISWKKVVEALTK
jgi:glycosyltransferase involved in cell wall biosynthesis